MNDYLGTAGIENNKKPVFQTKQKHITNKGRPQNWSLTTRCSLLSDPEHFLFSHFLEMQSAYSKFCHQVTHKQKDII